MLCTFCGKDIERPKLKITIGKQVYRQTGPRKNGGAGHDYFETEFQSACGLFEDICKMLQECDFKVDLVELRNAEKNKQLFWNLIYYFNEYHLPYEFILPYEDKSFERDLRRYEARSKKHIAIHK